VAGRNEKPDWIFLNQYLLNLINYVGYTGTDDEAGYASQALAAACGVDVMYASMPFPSVLRLEAYQRNISAILIEVGGAARYDAEKAAFMLKCLHNILAYTGIRPDLPVEKVRHVMVKAYPTGEFLNAPAGGFLKPHVKLKDRVEKGDLLCTVCDHFGNTQLEYRSPYDGLPNWHQTIGEILSDYGVNQGRVGFDLFPHFIYEALRIGLPRIELIDISDIWSDITAIKHPLEVELIRKALDIAMAGMRAAIDSLSEGRTELEISAAAEAVMRSMGSEMNPFIPVVASGAHSAIWERVATEKKLARNEMVILDFGCVYKGYTGDFARTVMFGKPTELQKRIFTTAYVAQKEAIKAMKPGVPCMDIDAVVRRVAEDSGMGKYIQPWASGHQLGYGLHGAPAIGPGVGDVLQEGMMINIEPSVNTYDNLQGGGVEIEDTVLITKDGAELVTRFPYDESLLTL